MTDSKTEVRSHCSVTSAPVPVETTCKKCGADIEMWSDEAEAACKKCGVLIKREDESAR